MTGRVHSIQTMGAVDGPGLRGVVFLQGCPLRCAYCHNPDTWDFHGGTEMEPSEVFRRLMRCRSYYKNGGVTASGGEPLMQSEFVSELFSMLRAEGIHTALDTSGAAPLENAQKVLQHTSLVLCDLKFTTDALYRRYTGLSMQPVIDFLDETVRLNIPLWIRHVVVPGLTDSNDEVSEIARISRSYPNLEKIELLPFKKLCISKYQSLGIPFPLADVPECSADRIHSLYRILGTA